jgi:L-fuconolactonase
MKQINRRVFLGSVAAAMVAASRLRAADAPIPIVDPHFHVWDLKRFRLPWLDHAGPLLNRDYTLRDYHEGIAGLDGVKSVYVEVDVDPNQREAEAQFASGLCAQADSAVGGVVIGGTPGAQEFAGYVRRFKDNPCVRGVRTSFPAGRAREAGFLRDIALLGELKMSFDLLLDAGALLDAAEVAAASPGTRFILDHCGNASPAWFARGAGNAAAGRWRIGIERLARQTNVACKISGVAENGPAALATVENVKSIVNHCLDSFGADRVMFATNWPVCLKSVTIRAWVDMVRQIIAPRGEAFARKLFNENAVTWYRLSGSGEK